MEHVADIKAIKADIKQTYLVTIKTEERMKIGPMETGKKLIG